MMSKDNGCWCTLKFHLPGEKKRHLEAQKKARKIMKLAEEADNRG